MNDLRVRLFGYVEVDFGGNVFLGPKIQSLFAFLLLNQYQFHPRERLTNLFWGDHDEKQARRCLNTTLWRLRNKLEFSDPLKGHYFLTGPGGEVAFNSNSNFWLDIAEFNKKLRLLLRIAPSDLSSQQVAEIETAIHLYRGDLMEGFYDDWIIQERERQRSNYIKSLLHLMSYYQMQHNYEKSSSFGQKLLILEPLREDVHRELMVQYFESGQMQKVYGQYEKCRQILRDELGILPMDETRNLFDRLINTPLSAKESPDPQQQLALMTTQITLLKDEIMKMNKKLEMLFNM